MNDKKGSFRVIQTIASTRDDHGGTSRSVPSLCDALADQGVDVHLILGAPASRAIACGLPRDASRVHSVPESALVRQFGVVRGFRRHLQMLCQNGKSVIIHDHGIWLPTNHGVAKYASMHAIARVVSPRGMLAAWSLQHRSWKKRLAWRLYQQRDLSRAFAFHATAPEEAEEIRALGLTQPIAVIPNGIQFPPEQVRSSSRPEGGARTALFLSRIHPKKNLATLLRAWKSAEVARNWRLVITGPDDCGHSAQLRQVVSELDLQEQVAFRGPASDVEKWQLYRDADLFVLPSFSENFGLVVAEALASGTPVITTSGTPWKEIEAEGFGWHVPPTTDGLARALREATRLPTETLSDRGQRGKRWVAARYSWADVARRMTELYQWLAGSNERPPFLM